MDTFLIIRRREEEKHGEYRTRRGTGQYAVYDI
jgi:hypothetical protein